MCKNCKASELGVQRQAELDAATLECQRLNVNPRIGGFIAKYAHPNAPRGERLNITSDQQAALERYNAALEAMKTLHEDYVWDRARIAAREAKERGQHIPYITQSDPRR